jgi:hypothetical protein
MGGSGELTSSRRNTSPSQRRYDKRCTSYSGIRGNFKLGIRDRHFGFGGSADHHDTRVVVAAGAKILGRFMSYTRRYNYIGNPSTAHGNQSARYEL